MRGGAAPMGQWSFRLDTDAQNLSPLLRFQTLSFRFAPAKMSKALSPPQKGGDRAGAIDASCYPAAPRRSLTFHRAAGTTNSPSANRRSPPAPSTGSGGGDKGGRRRLRKSPASATGSQAMPALSPPAAAGEKATSWA